jgi:hypothetical protein
MSGNGRAVATLAALTFAVSLHAVGAAEAQEHGPAPVNDSARSSYAPPRTPWGHPDLQGTYSNDDETGTPMARPAEFAGRTLASVTPEEMRTINRQRNERFNAGVAGTEFAGGLRPPTHLIFDTFERNNARAWLIVDPADGQIPPRVQAAGSRPPARRGVSTNANPNGPFNSWLDMGLYDRCITRGIPASMMPAGYGSRYDITQSPDSVAIRYEMIHETRVIPLLDRNGSTPPEGRPRLGSAVRNYMGDARGWWDGSTLVVETMSFRAESAPQGGSENLRMIERFTPTAAGTLEWSVTFDDPAVWARPWTYSMPLTRVDQSQQLFEYACHEGNHAMRNILSAARAAEGK